MISAGRAAGASAKPIGRVSSTISRLQPPPGPYRCRTIKLGTNSPGGPGFLEYPFFRCTIELSAERHEISNAARTFAH